MVTVTPSSKLDPSPGLEMETTGGSETFASSVVLHAPTTTRPTRKGRGK